MKIFNNCRRNYRKNYKTELKKLKAYCKWKALLTKKTIPEVQDHCFINYINSECDNGSTFILSRSYFWLVKLVLQILKMDFTDNGRNMIFINNAEEIDNKYNREYWAFNGFWFNDSLPGVFCGEIMAQTKHFIEITHTLYKDADNNYILEYTSDSTNGKIYLTSEELENWLKLYGIKDLDILKTDQ